MFTLNTTKLAVVYERVLIVVSQYFRVTHSHQRIEVKFLVHWAGQKLRGRKKNKLTCDNLSCFVAVPAASAAVAAAAVILRQGLLNLKLPSNSLYG